MYIDGTKVLEGNLLEVRLFNMLIQGDLMLIKLNFCCVCQDIYPPINPPEEIDDPEDIKPEDWEDFPE
jgi:hypothetical protein